MKPNIIKAVVAMEKFFTYNVDPDEFSSLLHRIKANNERDCVIIESLTELLDKSSLK